ncbi:MAG: hypothetical protein H8F28_22330 [Fibrella sp.]|nr:hypothetical protein [Armatimonadota bacterium]
MAYESFTLEQLKQKFSLTVVQSDDAFAKIPAIEPSPILTLVLERQRPLIVGKTSEKARSEFLVAPILVEVREIRKHEIAVFSGVKFDVDKKVGLYGYCDFLISRDPLLHEIQAPVVFITEAKKEDLNAGIPQCIAEMVAARLFNDKRGKPVSPIYGTVTDGTRWQFLQLKDQTVTINLREYTITELPQILGILTHMAS